MATLAGPLCEEPMMGVAFFVETWDISEEIQVPGYEHQISDFF